MTKNNSTNWARLQPKRYEGDIRQQFADTVEFMVFDRSKPSKVGIRADRVEMKIAEWNKLGIKFKQIQKMNYKYFSQPAYDGCLDVVRVSQVGGLIVEEGFYTNGSTTRVTKQSFYGTLETYIEEGKKAQFFVFKEVSEEFFQSVREKVSQIIQSTLND